MNPRSTLAFAAFAVMAAGGCKFELRTEPTTTTPATIVVTTETPVSVPGTPPVTRQPLDVLRSLPVDDHPKTPDKDKTRPPDETYNRDRDWQPEPLWGPPDRASCDTRERILQRDARPGTLAVGPQCQPFGVWSRVYVEGEVSNPSMIQIDHVVALSDAWRSGGWRWFDRSAPTHERAVARMLSYAQDPGVLWAVDGPENMRKNDKGPADWQPPYREAGCEYATRYVTIKAAWGLSITTRDRDAAGRLLVTCKETK